MLLFSYDFIKIGGTPKKNRGRAIPACTSVSAGRRSKPACPVGRSGLHSCQRASGFTLLSLAEVQSSLRFQMTLIQDLKFKIN